ncbi:MAG TPA: phage tail fiber protein [Roseomonas sp.]|nr:phage tail fiber protein [Roseomonas sp.]
MRYSYSDYTGDGSTKLFSVPFEYISQDHVSVTVDGASASFTWLNSNTIQLPSAPPVGAVVRVRRNTPKEVALVDFNDASVLTESALDLATRQNLLIAQEADDKAEDIVGEAVEAATGAASEVARAVPTATSSDVGKALVAQAGNTYGWSASFVPLTGGATMTGDYNLAGQFAATGQIYSQASLVTDGKTICASPRGVGRGSAMVDALDRFGPWKWSDGGYIEFNIDGTAGGINVFFSDARLKKDITPSAEPVLPLIRQLAFRDFRFKPFPGAPEGTVLPLQKGGVIAQDAQAIRPEWVNTASDGTLSLNAPLLLTNALKAIQELDAEVRALREQVASLNK